MKQQKSNKYKYLLYGGLGFFALVGLICTAAFLYLMLAMESASRETNRQAAEARSKRTAETVGTVTKIETGIIPDKDDEALGTVQFYVNGKAYRTTGYFGEEYSVAGVGEQGKVCYEPSNPENAQFFLKGFEQTCGQ